MKNQAFRRSKQRGSAIIYVFIFIFLFGALIFALTKGSRSGSSEVSDQRADLIAAEMIGFATKVREATKQLMIKGCADTAISFQSEWNKNTPESTSNTNKVYLNSNSPLDKSCHVFYPNGGGLNDVDIPKGAQNRSVLDLNTYRDSGNYFYIGTVQLFDSTNADLTMWAPFVTEKVCKAVNKKMGITGTATSVMGFNSVNPDWSFDGTYQNWGVFFGTAPESADLKNKMTGCVDGGSSRYFFYSVLHLRT